MVLFCRRRGRGDGQVKAVNGKAHLLIQSFSLFFFPVVFIVTLFRNGIDTLLCVSRCRGNDRSNALGDCLV